MHHGWVKGSEHDVAGERRLTDNVYDGRDGDAGLDFDLHDRAVPGQRQHLLQRGNGFTKDVKRMQARETDLPDTSATTSQAGKRVIMEDDRHPVSAHLYIEFNTIDAEGQGALESDEGVLRCFGRGAAMGDDQREERTGHGILQRWQKPGLATGHFCVYSALLRHTALMKVVVLCSGGMDSVTALHWARQRHEVAAVVSFDYGSKHNHREIPFAAEHARALGVAHTVITLGFVDRLFASTLLQSGGAVPNGHYEAETMRQTVVPFRNAIMLSIAAGFAESRGAEGLVIAAHGGDHAIYPDCREDFMRAMSAAIRMGTYAGLALLRPFIALNKAQIALEGARLGVDFARTWSCYRGGEIHCGRCGTCVERREAFLLAGLTDLTVYASADPLPPKPQPS
jgi:7-cyano-7-deazaguanine synthase